MKTLLLAWLINGGVYSYESTKSGLGIPRHHALDLRYACAGIPDRHVRHVLLLGSLVIMIKPTGKALTPWQPGFWITQTGYSLNAQDIAAGVQGNPGRHRDMLSAVDLTLGIIRRIMS